VDQESTLFTGERSNAFYETLLSSDASVSETVENCRVDRLEKLYASNSLLLYRLLDIINFAHNGKWTNTEVPRLSFPPLLIPVCFFLSLLYLEFSTNSKQHWQGLSSDWPRFIRDAGTLLYQILPETDTYEHVNQSDTTLKHLHSVCRRLSRMDRNKMLINFELTAMRLSSLLKGKDYPDTILALAAMCGL
jgi:hypothetical protein